MFFPLYNTEEKKKKNLKLFFGEMPNSGNPCGSAFWGYKVLFKSCLA